MSEQLKQYPQYFRYCFTHQQKLISEVISITQSNNNIQSVISAYCAYQSSLQRLIDVLDEDRQNSTYKHVSKIIQKVTLLITALRQNEE